MSSFYSPPRDGYCREKQGAARAYRRAAFLFALAADQRLTTHRPRAADARSELMGVGSV